MSKQRYFEYDPHPEFTPSYIEGLDFVGNSGRDSADEAIQSYSRITECPPDQMLARPFSPSKAIKWAIYRILK